VGNDIATNRISFNPQKLQAMSATVKIGRDGPVVTPSWIDRRLEH
jgi:hypothetical protein